MIVVEHDMRVVAASDWVIDIGPGAGEEGGRVVAAGTPAEVARSSSESNGAVPDEIHAPERGVSRAVADSTPRVVLLISIPFQSALLLLICICLPSALTPTPHRRSLRATNG